MAALKNYSIPRSNMLLSMRVIVIVVAADLTFGMLAFLIAIVRSSLDITTTFSVLLWLMFFAKIVMTAIAVYTVMRDWLGIRYFVIGHELVVQRSNRKRSEEDVYDLRRLRAASVEQGNMAKSFNAGNVKIKMADVEVRKEDEIVLADIENPRQIMRLLKAQRAVSK